MAFYNPRSKARPEGFGRALDVLRGALNHDPFVIFARAVSTPEERLFTVRLSAATPDMADMRTVVIVGNSQTRVIERAGAPIVYSPRGVPG